MLDSRFWNSKNFKLIYNSIFANFLNSGILRFRKFNIQNRDLKFQRFRDFIEAHHPWGRSIGMHSSDALQRYTAKGMSICCWNSNIDHTTLIMNFTIITIAEFLHYLVQRFLTLLYFDTEICELIDNNLL